MAPRGDTGSCRALLQCIGGGQEVMAPEGCAMKRDQLSRVLRKESHLPEGTRGRGRRRPVAGQSPLPELCSWGHRGWRRSWPLTLWSGRGTVG